jgi:pimeloyl-ACP methyl ester carboxylesterase
MKKALTLLIVPLLCSAYSPAQAPAAGESTTNNLVHTPGYETSIWGVMPNYERMGRGKQALIIIPGFGFDATVFDDFMEANKDVYTMYTITIPGYSKTAAPPMPVTDTSYGRQNWTRSVEQGLLHMMQNEHLEKAIVAGHFTQGAQLALRLAIDYPERVEGVVILGAPAKFVAVLNGQPQHYPLQSQISYVDHYWAPKVYKTISREAFNEGNYLPNVYALDSVTGNKLWQRAARQPLPVMVRYLCEFFTTGVAEELDKIKCPVLVLRPMFSDAVLQAPVNNYVRPQFIDGWNDAAAKNPLIKIKDIPNAATFVWKDNADEVYKAIKAFTGTLSHKP